MLRSTSSMSSPPKPGVSPGPAADSLKPDVDGHRAARLTGGESRGRRTRAGYLAKAQHHMLPAPWRYSPTANTICHRGPGQQPEVITAELRIAIGGRAAVTIADADSNTI